MTVTNRNEIETLIYKIFTALDPSGKNTSKLKKIFGEMNDNEFAKWLKEFLEDETDNFCLEFIEFEDKINFDVVENAAKILNIPLMEYVYLPHLSMDKDNVISTQTKCLVGYLNVKRTQQMVHKKNGLSLSSENRSALTGQVINHDKNGKDSDTESFLMVGLGLDKVLQEFHGPRSDDKVMERQMLNQIETKGYVSLDEMDSDSTNKTTLNTINTYLLSMGLWSDLVTDSYILPKTSEDVFD